MNGNPIMIDTTNFKNISNLFAPIFLKTDTKDISLKISNYILPCDKISTYTNHSIGNEELHNYYCTIFKPLSDKADSLHPIIILGSHFLKSFYTVIDTQKARIGIAEKSQQI